MVTVTLGLHTFQVAPTARKHMSLSTGLLEMPDGVDHVHYMGRSNKELTFTTTELSKTQIDDLYIQWDNDAELLFNVPGFEEINYCRIITLEHREIAGVPEQTYYEVTITVVLTS